MSIVYDSFHATKVLLPPKCHVKDTQHDTSPKLRPSFDHGPLAYRTITLSISNENESSKKAAEHRCRAFENKKVKRWRILHRFSLAFERTDQIPKIILLTWVQSLFAFWPLADKLNDELKSCFFYSANASASMSVKRECRSAMPAGNCTAWNTASSRTVGWL